MAGFHQRYGQNSCALIWQAGPHRPCQVSFVCASSAVQCSAVQCMIQDSITLAPISGQGKCCTTHHAASCARCLRTFAWKVGLYMHSIASSSHCDFSHVEEDTAEDTLHDDEEVVRDPAVPSDPGKFWHGRALLVLLSGLSCVCMLVYMCSCTSLCLNDHWHLQRIMLHVWPSLPCS